jgi:hypothetical protein
MHSTKIRIAVLALLALTAATTIASFATPFVAKITTQVSTGKLHYNIGFLNGDKGDSKLVFNYEWCSDCSGLNTAWLAVSILWGAPIVLQVISALLVFFSPSRAYWVLQLSFVSQACGGFGLCVRVLPLFREVLQNTPQPINIDWSIGPAGILGIIAIGLHFVTILVFAAFFARYLAETAYIPPSRVLSVPPRGRSYTSATRASSHEPS